MKLNYLLTSADARAGTERAIADQTKAMTARGYEVTVSSVYRLPQTGFDFGEGVQVEYITDLSESDSFPSLIIPEEWDNQFCRATDTALMNFLSNRDDDVLIASTPALAVYALLSCPASTKVVQEEHRNTMARGVTAEPLLRHGVNVDALVLLTERNREWLEMQWASQAPRMDVIPNSLSLVARPQSSGTQKVVMSAGRLVRGKGFVNLVRAFARVADAYPDWRLRIFGDGPDRDKIFTMARNLGVARQVEIFPPTEHIEEEWARASIGALASVSEGLPLVLLEARGAGLPLVAFDCETGPREIIEHGKDGYLVPLDDVGAFAEALRMLISDDSKRQTMSARAEESLQRFSPEAVSEQWDQLFQELAKNPLSARSGVQVTEPDTNAIGTSDGDLALSQLERELDSDSEQGTSATDFDRGHGKHSEKTDSAVAKENADFKESSIETDLHGMLPSNARAENRRLLAKMFSTSSLMARPIKSNRGFSWALRIEDREELLAHLAKYGSDVLEVRLYAGRTRLDLDGYSWRQDLNEVNWGEVTRLFLFHNFSVPGTRRHVGFASGITLEIWDHDERREHLYRAPRVNYEVDMLKSEQFASPMFAEWSSLRGLPLWSQVDFPIDAVYTWVNGNDPKWSAKRKEATGDFSPSGLAGGEIRYLNRDELRYSLRSLHQHAPWLRHIYVVTDGQRPAWLSEHEKVTVVDHRDIFPDDSVLPVFNSHSIESVLHNIPGLSEHFLYLNDDVFLMRDQVPENFFTSVGQAKFFPSSTKMNELGQEAEPHEAAGMNNRLLLEADFGVTITQGMLHTPHPHRVSVLREISSRYSSAVEDTRSHKFRDPSDLSMLSSLGQHFGYFQGAYVQGALNVSFVPLGAPDTMRRLVQLKYMQLDCLTFGESEDDPNPKLTHEMATTFMRSTFQIPAPWEKN
ncbi:stealth conserved region 3 domain-containing protein [Glutamicibacter sp. M10]|uniref:stealth conserved region 3 domain-containing protein n=1 Tax=Glutamicibacter sp. M10 TaxID=3023076 RepID=UPI0021C928A7|nr:stealth conserved region 3 domain-containing protein [Glutamicibacter sp. M10]UXN31285.1 stealth conserved region 3 domain-containing protein [Glutamicibacter sp. M10]